MAVITDIQPPVFVHCPGDMEVIVGSDGTATVNFTLPVASDNSGVEPTVTTSPPLLELPFTLTEVWVIF